MGDSNIEWRLGDGSTATLNATTRAYQVINISGLMQIGFQVGIIPNLVPYSIPFVGPLNHYFFPFLYPPPPSHPISPVLT